MKRILCVILVIALCIPLIGCGNISKTKAEDLALAALNLKRTTTPRIESSLDKSTNPPTYRVVFYQSAVNQTVIVNAQTGEILSITEEDAMRG